MATHRQPRRSAGAALGPTAQLAPIRDNNVERSPVAGAPPTAGRPRVGARVGGLPSLGRLPQQGSKTKLLGRQPLGSVSTASTRLPSQDPSPRTSPIEGLEVVAKSVPPLMVGGRPHCRGPMEPDQLTELLLTTTVTLPKPSIAKRTGML